MSIQTIHDLSRKAARKAAREHKRPAMVELEDMDTLEIELRIPNLGDYRPRGYKLIDTWFVDKSGFGVEPEPALTVRTMFARIRANGPGHGYAMIQEGQFQCYVGVFVPTKKGGNNG
jgi:hypothetical protein